MLSAPLGAQCNFLSIGIGLSAPLVAQRNFLSVGIALSALCALSERPKVIVLKIPTVRLWKHFLKASDKM